MKLRKVLFAIGMVAVFVMTFPAGNVMCAVEPQPPGEGEKIVGPEMWGVAIMDKQGGSASLRVKKVDGCDIDTDPQIVTGLNLELVTSERWVLYFRLTPGSVFGLPCEPIITKVKNFKIDGNLVSFDCQIKFVISADDPRTECE
jgi:hypothetical protein